MAAVDAPSAIRSELGEAPHWDAERRRLVYVDINGGDIHELDPATGTDLTTHVGAPVSFAVPVAGGAELVCGAGGDLTLVAERQQIMRRTVESDRPGNRFNDGKADPAGRLWFGSMSLARTPGTAALYCLADDGLRTVDDRITLSNGLDWDIERERMYYIDSTTQRIDVWRFDLATGAVADRRQFAAIDPADGLPDGLTLDADGCVWVALFEGGAMRRYDPDGRVIENLTLPVSCPTCPAFGGDDLSTLFVTTSRHKLNEAERAGEPLAGAVLSIDAGVRGRAPNVVAPDVLAALTALPGNDEAT